MTSYDPTTTVYNPEIEIKISQFQNPITKISKELSDVSGLKFILPSGSWLLLEFLFLAFSYICK